MEPYYQTDLGTLYCGDCLEVMKGMPDGRVDLTVTSPPYDNLREYKGYVFDFEGIANQLYRATKQGGVVVWVVGDETIDGSETGTSFRQALYFKEIGFNLHTMIWEKQTFTDTGSLKVRYPGVYEYMFVCSKGHLNTFNPIKDRPTKGLRKKYSTVRQADGTLKPISSIGKIYGEKPAQRFNVWKINTEVSNSKRCHPAQFPEQLAHDHVISWSNEGDTVFDPMVGSGTVPKMCEKLSRKWVACDSSEEYCAISKDRIEKEAQQLKLFGIAKTSVGGNHDD